MAQALLMHVPGFLCPRDVQIRSQVHFAYQCGLFHSNGVSGGDDDEWDYSDRTFDPNKPGVPVRALYDYEGVEADELSFKVGKFSSPAKWILSPTSHSYCNTKAP